LACSWRLDCRRAVPQVRPQRPGPRLRPPRGRRPRSRRRVVVVSHTEL